MGNSGCYFWRIQAIPFEWVEKLYFLDSLLFGNYTVVLIFAYKDENSNKSFKYKVFAII